MNSGSHFKAGINFKQGRDTELFYSQYFPHLTHAVWLPGMLIMGQDNFYRISEFSELPAKLRSPPNPTNSNT